MIVYAMFLTFMLENSYSQIVHFPTRDANILDFILTNDTSLFTVVDSDLPVGTSDHSSVKFELLLPRDSHVPSFSTATVKYNWHQGDYEGMNTFLLDVNWYSVICCNPSAHDAWNAFKDILYMAIDIFVPRVEHPPNSLRIRRGGCNSRDLSKCACRKRRLWRLLKANPDNSRARVKYRECAHEWRRLVVQQENSDEEKIISVDNLGAFYIFVNKRILTVILLL